MQRWIEEHGTELGFASAATAIVLLMIVYVPKPEDVEHQLIDSCQSPVFAQAYYSHTMGDQYVYSCADGRMIRISRSIVGAKVPR
jgi:hypothetical protein